MITTNLSSRVRHFYPAWNEPDKNTSEYFDVSLLYLIYVAASSGACNYLHIISQRYKLYIKYVYFLYFFVTVATTVFTSDKGGGKCFCPCLFVCLSVSKITQKCMHGFG